MSVADGNQVAVIEVELTPLDQLYYVSRESGDDFGTEPYVMHTALYYAFGLLPSRFRVVEQSPKYVSHIEDSAVANGVYIHPATAVGRVAGQYTTRRFAVKGDEFRQRSEQENKNLKETGFQRFLDPGTELRTYIRVDEGDPESLAARLDGYCRLGKKMTATRVRTAVHHADLQSGRFELGHPIGNVDMDTDAYEILGNIYLESMMPVNLITGADLRGDYVRVKPQLASQTDPVALPARAVFLYQHR